MMEYGNVALMGASATQIKQAWYYSEYCHRLVSYVFCSSSVSSSDNFMIISLLLYVLQ